MYKKDIYVLIVDDQEINRYILVNILQNQGYKTITAEDGIKGRELAKTCQPDLILIDILMPGEDGFETVRKLKKDPETTDIPIIFISAIDDVDYKVKGLELGAWDYVTKPFEQDEIIARVRNYLQLNHTFQRIIEEQALRLKNYQKAQKAILVKADEIPQAKFAVSLKSTQPASGYFYDVFEIADDIIGYFVAEISNYNLSSSFNTAVLKALVRQNSSQIYTPAETLSIINKILKSTFKIDNPTIGVFAILNRKSQKCHITNFGYLPLVYISVDKNNQFIGSNSDMIGIKISANYSCQEINVTKGDRFYFLSSGLIEIMKRGEKSEDTFLELTDFFRNNHRLPVDKLIEALQAKELPASKKIETEVLLLAMEV